MSSAPPAPPGAGGGGTRHGAPPKLGEARHLSQSVRSFDTHMSALSRLGTATGATASSSLLSSFMAAKGGGGSRGKVHAIAEAAP